MKKIAAVIIFVFMAGIAGASTYTAIGTISPGTRARSSTINDLNSNIATAFALLPDEDELALGTFNAALDTGTVNTYLVSLPTTPAAYVDNMQVVMIPLNTNTGASTINVDSLGVVSIRLQDGSTALSAGDIVVGVPVELRYSSVTGFFHINRAPATSGAVLDSDFDATTFLYATSDNSPQAKTPTEVRAILNTSKGNLTGKIAHASSTDATYNIPEDQHYGGSASNGDADAIEMDLDAALAGMSIIIRDGAGGVITLDPNGTDYIVYDGTAGSAGEAFISSGAKYDFMTLVCYDAGVWEVVGHDTNGWTEETP